MKGLRANGMIIAILRYNRSDVGILPIVGKLFIILLHKKVEFLLKKYIVTQNCIYSLTLGRINYVCLQDKMNHAVEKYKKVYLSLGKYDTFICI